VIDTHTHLSSCKPPDAELVAAAAEQGVRRIVTIGMDGETGRAALAAAAEFPGVRAAIGRHPHKTEGFGPADLDELRELASDPRCVAIGETGLDYYRDYAPRADQHRAFEAQIDLARELGKPLVIHTRAADDDTLAEDGERAAGTTVILHCFSMPDRLEDCLRPGWFLSFAGNATYPSAEGLREAARDVPVDRLLVETDAPYLTPVPLRGKPNEPANVVHTARMIAELRGMTYEELDALVESNAARAFGWPLDE
jgi:TatD DNase family protein